MNIVTHDEWARERTELLAKEKEFTRLRDELATRIQAMPWAPVGKEYTFEGPNGRTSLAELFETRSQLIVYHFMFGPDWEAGCKSCSLVMDHIAPSAVHIEQRDVAFAVVSRAPLAKLAAFQERMGWEVNWVSSLESDFNDDFHVSVTEARRRGGATSNTTTRPVQRRRDRSCRDSASSPRTRRAGSSTPTPPIRAASTPSWASTACWTSCRADATRRGSPTAWSGFATTTATGIPRHTQFRWRMRTESQLQSHLHMKSRMVVRGGARGMAENPLTSIPRTLYQRYVALVSFFPAGLLDVSPDCGVRSTNTSATT